MPSGSGLHLLTTLHFLLGGLGLGLVGALLALREAGARGWRLLWIPFGKYVSTLLLLIPLTLVCEARIGGWLGEDPLARWPWIWAAQLLVSWLLSALVEWPFFRCSLVGAPGAFLLALRANAVGLLLLVVCYLPFCRFGPLGFARGVECSGEGFKVFYLREGAVFAKVPGETETRLLQGVHAGTDARLYSRRGEAGWDLWLRDPDHGDQLLLPCIVPAEAEMPQQPALAAHRNKTVRMVEPTLAQSHGRPAGWEGGEASAWAVQVGAWAAEGLEASSRAVGSAMRVALDTPLLSWRVRCATRLPGEQVLFQLGPFLWWVDLGARRLDCFARGQGALVALPATSGR